MACSDYVGHREHATPVRPLENSKLGKGVGARAPDLRLEQVWAIEAPGVTHPMYRVAR